MFRGDRLKKLRLEKNLTQEELGKIFNVSHATINRYEKGVHQPDSSTINKLAEFFNVSTDYLLGRSDIRDLPKGAFQLNNFIKIPVVRTIRAGEPILTNDNIVGYEYIPPTDFPSDELFGLKVIGDSMDLSHIVNGCTVIVHKQDYIDNGDIAVVIVNDEEATVKKFYNSDTTVTLMPHSTNPDHQPRIIDITKTEVKIIGKVIKIVLEP